MMVMVVMAAATVVMGMSMSMPMIMTGGLAGLFAVAHRVGASFVLTARYIASSSPARRGCRAGVPMVHGFAAQEVFMPERGNLRRRLLCRTCKP
jgi:hypothetical protein